MRYGKGTTGPKTQLRDLIQQAGVTFPLSDRFYRKIVLSMNDTQGLTGESLVHTAVIGLLNESTDFNASGLPKRQQVFETPDGIRRTDLYFASTRFTVEIKSGYVRATREFRTQGKKDRWLWDHRADEVSEVLWILLRGATANARRHLEHHRLPWIDFDLEKMRPPTMSEATQTNG